LFPFAGAEGVLQTEPFAAIVMFDSGGVLRADRDWHHIGA